MTSYSELPRLLKRSTSSVGSLIAIGKAFVERGSEEMDSVIIPKLRALLDSKVIPRVLPSYAILFWFTIEVCTSFPLSYYKLAITHVLVTVL